MKSFSRVTSSFVMAAAMLAVIIGSLCFSAGEGLRLTPFPNAAFSQNHDSGTVVSVKEAHLSLAKYGPLDVPVQSQKRGKRSTLDLASAAAAKRELVVTFFVPTSEYQPNDLNLSPHVARPSGRAPPFSS